MWVRLPLGLSVFVSEPRHRFCAYQEGEQVDELALREPLLQPLRHDALGLDVPLVDFRLGDLAAAPLVIGQGEHIRRRNSCLLPPRALAC